MYVPFDKACPTALCGDKVSEGIDPHVINPCEIVTSRVTGPAIDAHIGWSGAVIISSEGYTKSSVRWGNSSICKRWWAFEE